MVGIFYIVISIVVGKDGGFEIDWEIVILMIVKGVSFIFIFVFKEFFIKVFVFMGSIVVVVFLIKGNYIKVGLDIFNEVVVKFLYFLLFYGFMYGFNVYVVSKVVVEEEFLRFMKEYGFYFIFNIVFFLGVIGEFWNVKYVDVYYNWVMFLY